MYHTDAGEYPGDHGAALPRGGKQPSIARLAKGRQGGNKSWQEMMARNDDNKW